MIRIAFSFFYLNKKHAKTALKLARADVANAPSFNDILKFEISKMQAHQIQSSCGAPGTRKKITLGNFWQMEH
ncbi:MAG: hypothetical protein P8M25_18615 [Paracoccaceae bacterium]|nr:hypothetical protein [Paracoccaceae bacterium]